LDLYILETFPTIDENCLGQDAIRFLLRLPIRAHLTYSEEYDLWRHGVPRGSALLTNKQLQSSAHCTLGRNRCFPFFELAGVDDRVIRHPQTPVPHAKATRNRVPEILTGVFAHLRSRRPPPLGVRIRGGPAAAHAGALRAMDEAGEIAAAVKATAQLRSGDLQSTRRVVEREPESKFWKKLQKNEFAVWR